MMNKTNEYQDTLILAAYLFAYPDDAWWARLPECRQALGALENRQNKQAMVDLLDYIEAMGHKAYEELYVRTFEFSSNTNLYLTMHDRTDFGKQAREMLEFKTLFLANGFDLDKELPDFLPAMARPKIELLRQRFLEARLAHTFLLDVVLTEADELKEATADRKSVV